MTVDLEILCIGNELLIGKILNTNAQWIAKQATDLAVNVKRVTVIQDLVAEIASALQEALARKPHFLITTGGLGPTFDDKTLEGIAAGLNRKLELNKQALEMVQQRSNMYAKKRGLPTPVEMTKPRIKMAMLPQDAKFVSNPIGTAACIQVYLPDTTVFVLPGVPAEMEAVFSETIAPKIKEATGGLIFCERSMFLEGIGESVLAPYIDQVMAQYKGVYIKSHPLKLNANGKPQIELHLTIIANENLNPQGLIDGAVELMQQLLAGFSDVVVRLD
ncbi:MAG: molybdopterin-binding protein [Candidatus Bathyarchaeia archaeon]